MSSLGRCGAVALLVLAAAACDTGDGRTLREPPPGATAPPVPSSTTATTEGAVFGTTQTGPGAGAGTLQVTSVEAGDGCASPGMTWAGVPAGTVELALTAVAVTGGAPDWLVTGIDPVVTGIGRGGVPETAVEVVAWQATCPPTSTYQFTLWALTEPTGVAPGDAPTAALGALESTPGVTTVSP